MERLSCDARKAQTNAAWADALAELEPEATVLTRAFSGRLGRSIETDYTRGAKSPEVPVPAPYPAQGGLTVSRAANRIGRERRSTNGGVGGTKCRTCSSANLRPISSGAFGRKSRHSYQGTSQASEK